jgi:hypothetical protein
MILANSAAGKRKPKGNATNWERIKSAIDDGPLLSAMAGFERLHKEIWPLLDIEILAAIALIQYRCCGDEMLSDHLDEYFSGNHNLPDEPEEQATEAA